MTALEGGFEVIPIAIEFEKQDVAWVGQDTFIPHFLEIFSKYKEINVKVAFGEPRIGTDWEQLRDECHEWVNAELNRMRAEFDNSV